MERKETRMATRKIMYDALVAHAKGHIEKHKANVEIYFNQSSFLTKVNCSAIFPWKGYEP